MIHHLDLCKFLLDQISVGGMPVGLHGQPESQGLPVSDPPEPLLAQLDYSARLRTGGLEARMVSILYIA